jgi:hypothetical protein
VGIKEEDMAMKKSLVDSLIQIEFTIRTNALESWPRGLSWCHPKIKVHEIL